MRFACSTWRSPGAPQSGWSGQCREADRIVSRPVVRAASIGQQRSGSRCERSRLFVMRWRRFLSLPCFARRRHLWITLVPRR